MTTPDIISRELPRTIRAAIHPDAINRVPAFFNATTRDVLNEVFQNARRSGATQVDVGLDRKAKTITVEDDGMGIPDPDTLLSFGRTGWDNDTTRREHPAGMGLYALARRDQVIIRSKHAGGPAWQVELIPENFSGEIEAPVDILPDQGESTGTSVTFRNLEQKDWQTISDIEATARYYPIPVYRDGIRVEQEEFLKKAIHIQDWEGVQIGVYQGHQTDIMNFHGLTVQNPRLPNVRSVSASWRTKVDVKDCPHLELTLPARKEVIETPFMEELRRACRRAIYTAMTFQDEPVDVPKSVQDDAAEMGIVLPDARARLRSWTPESARIGYPSPADDFRDAGEDTIVMDIYLVPADQQALARAAQRAGITDRLMRDNRDLRGYGWYDALTMAKELTVTVTIDQKEHLLHEVRRKKLHLEEQRPDQIAFAVLTVDGDNQKKTLTLPADLAFENKAEEKMEENRPLVTKGSDIKVSEVIEMMTDAYFSPSDDQEADSPETQLENRQEAYEKTALTLLLSKDEMVRESIASAVERHVFQRIPRGSEVTVRMKRGNVTEIAVEVQQGEDETAGTEQTG